MNLEEMQNRNREALIKLIKEYEIEFTYDQLINEFTSIFIHTDFDLQRIRLIGVQKIYRSENKLDFENKRKQLFVIKKTQFNKLLENTTDFNTELQKLNFLKNIYYQNIYLKDILNLESVINNSTGFNFVN